MKKTNLIKVVLVMILSLMLILFSTNVLATDEYEDLTQALGTGSGNTNANTGNTNTNTGNTNTRNTNNNTNNSSIYNNSSLPDTGISDSIPVMILLVVFAISAVFAYKKIKEYKNI